LEPDEFGSFIFLQGETCTANLTVWKSGAAEDRVVATFQEIPMGLIQSNLSSEQEARLKEESGG